MKTEVGHTVIVDVEGEVKLSGWGEREAGSGVRLLLLQELNPGCLSSSLAAHTRLLDQRPACPDQRLFHPLLSKCMHRSKRSCGLRV